MYPGSYQYTITNPMGGALNPPAYVPGQNNSNPGYIPQMGVGMQAQPMTGQNMYQPNIIGQPNPYQPMQPQTNPYVPQQQQQPRPYNGAMPMPSSGSGSGNAPVAGQPPGSGSGGGVPRFQTPGAYPQVERISYTIAASNKDKFANLYSTLAAIEALETEVIEGNISQEESNSLYLPYKQAFDMITRALKMDEDQVRAFCDAVSLSAGYALSRIYEAPSVDEPTTKPTKDKIDQRDFMTIGGAFVTLQDMCQVGVKVNNIIQQFDLLVKIMKKTTFLKENSEAQSIVHKWNSELKKLPGDNTIPPDVSQKLLNDVILLNGLFENYIRQ